MNFTVTTKTEIPASRVADLLCCALEGGSTYWCESFKPSRYPGETRFGYAAVAYGVPFTITHNDGEKLSHPGGGNRIAAALSLMADKFPKAWADFIHENEDAITGDLFFQLLCFGEEVYV